MTRVLVVEDHPVIAALIEAYLGPGVTVTLWTSDFEQLTDPAHQQWAVTDVIACDLRLTGVSGLALLAMVGLEHPQIRRVAVTAAEWLLPAALEVADKAHIKTDDLHLICDSILGR